ncbi:hypothetical protein B0H16DRAFT_1690395 [Mycena metata]|uniref:G-patch domain-containing protein n=1 Tax=Mycena metata TaxID=1033252 RepID=A0AAD7J192_9AGAR|nr:hypothetical protein B0H16DRAFT_1690395 [Mycena metata]
MEINARYESRVACRKTEGIQRQRDCTLARLDGCSGRRRPCSGWSIAREDGSPSCKLGDQKMRKGREGTDVLLEDDAGRAFLKGMGWKSQDEMGLESSASLRLILLPCLFIWFFVFPRWVMSKCLSDGYRRPNSRQAQRRVPSQTKHTAHPSRIPHPSDYPLTATTPQSLAPSDIPLPTLPQHAKSFEPFLDGRLVGLRSSASPRSELSSRGPTNTALARA